MTRPYDPYEEVRQQMYPHAPKPRQSRVGELRTPPPTEPHVIELRTRDGSLYSIFLMLCAIAGVLFAMSFHLRDLAKDYRAVHAKELEAAKPVEASK